MKEKVRTKIIIINNDNSGQEVKPKLRRKKKELDFAVPTDHRVKRRNNIYLALARELKRLGNMKLTPIVIGALETIFKDLEK